MRKNGIMQKLLCGLVLCAALLGSSAATAPLLPYPARLMEVSAAEPVMLWDETESLRGKRTSSSSWQEYVSISETSIVLSVGEKRELFMIGNRKLPVSWRSKRSRIAGVSEDGVVVGISAGTTEVIAETGGREYRCTVRVEAPALSKTRLEGTAGSNFQLRVNGTKRKILWKSSDTSVVKVSSAGKLAFLRPGTAEISASVGSTKLVCRVTVFNTMAGAVVSGCLEGLTKTDARIAERAHEIYAETISDDMTLVEKILAIHDYIVEHTEYAYAEYQNGTLSDMPCAFSPEGVLLKQRAVCQGYAETMELFLDALGAENRLIYGLGVNGGEKISHVWNLVKLDGSWYHIDATWDDPVVDGKDSGRVYYDYFLMDDAAMKKDHIWQKKDYPAAKGGEYKDYGYRQLAEEYRAAGRYLENLEDYADEIAARCAAGEWECELMFSGQELPETDAMLRRVAALVPGKGIKAYFRYVRCGNYTILTTEIVAEEGRKS